MTISERRDSGFLIEVASFYNKDDYNNEHTYMNDNNTTTTITTATSTTNNERTKRRYSNTKETDLINNNVNSSDSGLNNVVNTLRNSFNSSKLFMFRPCSIGTTSGVDVNNNNNDDDTSITHSGIYINNDGDDD